MPASITSESDEKTLSVFQRPHHDRLWFKDGTIVIATETVLFRVYSGMLTQQSCVFQDMIRDAESQDWTEKESLDGNIIIHVKDDPLQLGHFLLALFDGS